MTETINQNITQENASVKRNLWLDLFKIFLSFLVICIHFAGETYTHHPMYRLAVPMFFMISGYFCYHKDKEREISKSKGAIKRTLKYMLVGFSIYIVFDFIMCYVDGRGVGYWFTTLFYENPLFDFVFLNRSASYYGYQLWFLNALLIVSIVHYFIVKYNKQKWYYVIIPVGIMIYLYFQGYMKLFQPTDMPIRYTRNAWFFGLPLYGIGYTMAKFNLNKKKWYKYIYLALAISFFVLQIYESNIVVMEMYISTILSGFFFLQFFIGLPKIKCDWFYNWFGKSIAFYIYILHVMIGTIVGHLFDFPNLMLKCFVILIVCFAVYEISFLLCKFIKYHKKQKDLKI